MDKHKALIYKKSDGELLFVNINSLTVIIDVVPKIQIKDLKYVEQLNLFENGKDTE